jgi:hypothetical protein
MTVEFDLGSGFGSEQDVTASLNPAGASGITTFFNAGAAIAPPDTIGLRWTLSVGGTPTYQQTVTIDCPNAVPSGTETGTLQLVSENVFATADPPAGTDPATAIVAQPTTTG